MTAVYLASAYSRRSDLARYATRLRRDGVTVTSRWHSIPEPIGTLTHADYAGWAAMDRDDLEAAQVLCLFNGPPGTYDGQGGAFCELGMALALGLRVVVVSHRSSVYDYLPSIVFCQDPESALVYMAGLTQLLERKGSVMTTDKAWKVGSDDIGYLIVKAPTCGKARIKGGGDVGALDWEEMTHLRVLRQPAYDHLPEREAQRKWETDMRAEFGPDWGDA